MRTSVISIEAVLDTGSEFLSRYLRVAETISSDGFRDPFRVQVRKSERTCAIVLPEFHVFPEYLVTLTLPGPGESIEFRNGHLTEMQQPIEVDDIELYLDPDEKWASFRQELNRPDPEDAYRIELALVYVSREPYGTFRPKEDQVVVVGLSYPISSSGNPEALDRQVSDFYIKLVPDDYQGSRFRKEELAISEEELRRIMRSG